MASQPTYKDFVRKFLAENKEDGLTPKERMAACAKAWKALSNDEKSVSVKSRKSIVKKKDVVKTAETTTTATKPSHGHKTIISGFDVGGLLTRIEQATESEPAAVLSKKAAASLVIRRTKSNQRALNNVARAFSRDVKNGNVKSVNEAFMRGLKAVFDLQHGAQQHKSTQTSGAGAESD